MLYPKFILSLLLLCCSILIGMASAADTTNPDAEFPPLSTDPFMGYYAQKGDAGTCTADVIAKGDGMYQGVLTVKQSPNAKPEKYEMEGSVKDDVLSMKGNKVQAAIKGKFRKMTMKAKVEGKDGDMKLKYVERQSPSEKLKPIENAKVLLPFSESAPSLDAWSNQTWLALPKGIMQVGQGSNFSKDQFGSIYLHLEFCIPYEPKNSGQGRSNSGVYFNNRYEVQVLDSFGLEPKSNECGGIYRISDPRVNASYPPLRWQTYDIFFKAPKVAEDGSTKDLPELTVYHNGILIQDKVKVPEPTSGRAHTPAQDRIWDTFVLKMRDWEKAKKEAEERKKKFGVAQPTPPQALPPFAGKGQLILQDHGNPLRYRNIWVVEADANGEYPESLKKALPFLEK